MDSEYVIEGLIYLLDQDGNVISARKYCGKRNGGNGRDIIIENWRKMYAAAFSRCSIQISPLLKDCDRPGVRRLIEHGGCVYSINDIATMSGLRYSTVKMRIRHGWSIERILSTQAGPQSGKRKKEYEQVQ